LQVVDTNNIEFYSFK